MDRRLFESRRRRVTGPYPFLKHHHPIGFAHRGGAAHGDENTISSFQRAIDVGYRYIETDVHSTADGVAVLFHDADLTRITGDTRQIAHLTWNDLSHVRHHGETIVPRLDDVLQSFPDVYFNIDVKADAAVEVTLNALAVTNATQRALLGSFSDRRMASIRAGAGPRLATSMAQWEAARLWAASRVGKGLWGFTRGAAAVQVPLYRYGQRIVDARFVNYAHQLGVAVHVWTIDDPGTMMALLDLGVDGIMTDEIEILADVYRSRGLWPARNP